ncbi:MAG TPA: PAS domain S-box protein, partial [Desulfomonilia bacterium]|nr:PAS domain S-box protein [Desulfomonilia bacterium]
MDTGTDLETMNELKSTQERLKQVEERYRFILKNTSDLFILHDMDGRILDVNIVGSRLGKLSEEDLIGIKACDFIPERYRREYDEYMEKIIRDRDVQGSLRIRTLDGDENIMEYKATLISDENGTVMVQVIAQDVTERHRALKALQKSEEKYRTILDSIEDGYYEMDLAGSLTFVNYKIAEISGYPPDKILGVNYRDYTDDENARNLFKTFNDVFITGKPLKGLQWELIRKDGSRVSLESSISLIRDSSGKPKGFRGIVRDISDTKRVETALSASEERFRDIFDNVSDYLFFHDLEGKFDFNECNARVREDWSLIDESQTSANLKDLIVERYRCLFPEYISRVVKNGKDEGLVSVKIRDGSEHILEYKNSLVYGQDGPVGVRGSARDITDRLRAENALRKSEEKYRSILENIEEGYYEVDLKGNFTFFNDSICRMIGYTREETVGMNYTRFMDEEYASKTYEVFHKVFKTNKPNTGSDWEIIRKDGKRGSIETSITLLRNSKGEPVGFRGIMRDTTHRKQAEELQKEMVKSEARNRAKSEFLAHMSHEIRTPLNGIIGMTEIALDTALADEQREVISTVYRESENLLSLINDILDFSKLESQRLELEHIPFDLKALMEDITRSFTFMAKQKDVELVLYISPEMPLLLLGDPGRLRQILTNLVGNALKFTNKGEVLIKVEYLEGLGSKTMARFSVKDTGIGIPRNKQGAIFESFIQVDSSTTRNYGGTGLGLSISKRLAELMGGRIGVESEQGNGSTFWFTSVFSHQEDKGVLQVSAQIDLSGLKVLVVDDNVSARSTYASYLKEWGCITVEATSGREALSILKEREGTKEPIDLVVTDSHMPLMDGFELASHIRAELNRKTDVPIIMLTPVGSIGDGLKCSQMGIQGYLPKPVRYEELRKAINAVIKRKSGTSSDTSSFKLITRYAMAEESGTGVRILLADDYPTNQQVAQRHLTNAGYHVDVVDDGLQALEAYKRSSYDLIIMDIEMPNMDGFASTKAIREIE